MSNEITTAPITDIEIARENAAFEMLQRQAKMFASSSLVPKEFQGNIANCAIGINIAKRLGADPFMVLQNIDIIHGRPSFRATFLIAMVNASGRFEPLQFRLAGDEGKPNRSCVAWTKSKVDGATLEGPKITLEMAKAEGWSAKNGSKWLTMPELMLRYRAAAFFARLYAPDITLGMMTAEEAIDTVERDVTPPANASQSKLFEPTVPPDTVVGKAQRRIQTKPETPAEPDALPIDAPQETLPQQIGRLCIKDDISWTQVARIMADNGLVDDIFPSLETAPDEALKICLEKWSQIVAVAEKGGAA